MSRLRLVLAVSSLAVLLGGCAGVEEMASAGNATSTTAVSISTTAAGSTAGSSPTAATTTAVASLTAVERFPMPRIAEPDPNRPRYDRETWDGKGWADADRDGCNTRAEVLQAESAVPTVSKPTNCTVLTGQWTEPYRGKTVTDASALQIDHVVALGDAERSGGWAWPAERKLAFANNLADPDALVAVDGAENERKADKGPDQWTPPNAAYRCTYVATYARVKATWDLTVTPAQAAAIERARQECP